MPACRRLPCTGLLACLLLLLPGRLQAQELTGAIKVGLSVTTMQGTSVFDFSPKLGWSGGAAFGYDFGNGFILQPEFLYIVKGAHADGRLSDIQAVEPGAGDPAINLTWDLTYLEIPVLAIYRFETTRGIHPKLFAGPAASYNLDAVVHVSVEGSDLEMDETDESIQDVDYGFVVGAGAEIELGFERASVGLRATLGRSNIRSAEPAIRNRGVLLYVGLIF